MNFTSFNCLYKLPGRLLQHGREDYGFPSFCLLDNFILETTFPSFPDVWAMFMVRDINHVKVTVTYDSIRNFIVWSWMAWGTSMPLRAFRNSFRSRLRFGIGVNERPNVSQCMCLVEMSIL